MEYTITNHSHSTYPKAQVQAEYIACTAHSDDPWDTDTCPDSAATQAVTTTLRTQWHDGTGWKDVPAPDDDSVLAETLTMSFGTLPADSTRKFRFRFRFTGSEALDSNVRRLVVSARVNGKAVGTSERSLDIASRSPSTFADARALASLTSCVLAPTDAAFPDVVRPRAQVHRAAYGFTGQLPLRAFPQRRGSVWHRSYRLS